MSIRSLFIAALLTGLSAVACAQVKTDTIPMFMADSLNTVYIYADSGTALNRVDKEGRRQGLWEKKYPDGHIRYRGHFWDNEPTGVFKNYYDQGDSLEAIRVYSDDGKSAYAHLFYVTGALYAEGKYIGEKEDSIWKFYDENQRLIRKDFYKNGKKEGKSVIFYPDGNVLEVKSWKNDTADGPFEQYYDGGGIMEEGTYVRGGLEDTFYIYDLDGSVAKKGIYLNDMHEGNWIDYRNGQPRDTLIYHRGKCLNCQKYTPTKHQMDSLRVHYHDLQQKLDHPSNDLNEEATPPDENEEQY